MIEVWSAGFFFGLARDEQLSLCQYVLRSLTSGGTAHWASGREVHVAFAGTSNCQRVPLCARVEDHRACELPTGGHILVMGPPPAVSAKAAD